MEIITAEYTQSQLDNVFFSEKNKHQNFFLELMVDGINIKYKSKCDRISRISARNT